MEWLELGNEKRVRSLSLIPITAKEVDFKTNAGLEALKSQFEQEKINYLDFVGKSLV